MFRFILTRLAMAAVTFLGITALSFFLIRAVPGDPIEIRAGERGISPERHAQLLHDYGLDRPVSVQFFSYIGGVLQGDLGASTVNRRPVFSEFWTLFPATIELGTCAMIFAVVFGLPAGILAATNRSSPIDHGIMGASLTGYSMPIFWWGLLLILIFSVGLGWTPVSGRISALYYVEPHTGFMLIDSLLSDEKGSFLSAL